MLKGNTTKHGKKSALVKIFAMNITPKDSPLGPLSPMPTKKTV